jgi:hypothetical protein
MGTTANESAQVPLWVVTLLLGERWWERPEWSILATGIRRVGRHLEIETAVDGHDYVREAATGYLAADRVFARDVRLGRSLGPWVATRRPVGRWRQGAGTKSSRRGDLSAQLAAIGRHRELRDIVAALLVADVDFGELASLGARVERDELVTRAFIGIEGNRLWEADLGGAPWPQEIEREFMIEANHAPWRDRQVRRLAEVRAFAIEMHTDPSPWQELISDGLAAPMTEPVSAS